MLARGREPFRRKMGASNQVFCGLRGVRVWKRALFQGAVVRVICINHQFLAKWLDLVL